MRLHVAALFSLLGCTTTAENGGGTGAPSDSAAANGKNDVDPSALCQLRVEVDEAASRLKLATARTQFEKRAKSDRNARFAALLAIQNDQDRFHAFHDETQNAPSSALGPLGECFVYAEWKMADRAQQPCAAADKLLAGAPIVDVARAELARRRGQLAEAYTLVDNALSQDGACAAAHVESAKIHEAANDPAKAATSWENALAAWPKCALCAVQLAKNIEQSKGREDAIPAWERALTIAPDHTEALKRYGAALAGHDDAKALAAYEQAIAAGVDDVQTLVGTAQLAKADPAKALGYAERATEKQANDVDAWRMVMQLSADGQKQEKAAREVLRLVDEDLTAHLVLARAAKARDELAMAVEQYDRAGRAIAGGRTEPLDATQLEAAKKEHTQLLNALKVREPGPKGKAEAVVSAVRRNVQDLFVERLKKNKGMKGALDVAVTTVEGGNVEDVFIEKDTLGDAYVAASVVANLRRANISGPPKRYVFTLEFQ